MKTIFESVPESVVSALGWTLVHSVWQGTLFALIAFVGFYFLNKKSASLRYNLGVAMLCVQVIASAITFAYCHVSSLKVNPDRTFFTNNTVSGLQKIEYNLSLTAQAQMWLHAHLHELVVCWLIGAVLLMLRFAGGWMYTVNLRSKAKTIMDQQWRVRFGVLAAKLNMSQSVEFRETAQTMTPMVIGAFRPVILIPFGLLTGFPPSQVEAILAHELAHIRRNDYLVNLLQSLVEVVFFFHPGLWWLSDRIRTEREHCCDDVALSVCDNKLSLAHALVKIAEWQSAPQLAMAFASKKSFLLTRIQRVVGIAPKAKGFQGNWPITVFCLFMLAGISVYAVGQKSGNTNAKKKAEHTKTITGKQIAKTNARDIELAEPNEVIDVDAPEAPREAYTEEFFSVIESDSLSKKMEVYQRKMEALQKEMDPLLSRQQELMLEMEKKHFDVDRYNRELEKIEWAKEKASSMRSNFTEKHSTLLRNEAKLPDAEMEKKLSEFEQRINEQEQKMIEFNHKIAQSRTELNKVEIPLQALENEMEELSNKINEIGAKMGLTSFDMIQYSPEPPAPPKPPKTAKVKVKAPLSPAPPIRK